MPTAEAPQAVSEQAPIYLLWDAENMYRVVHAMAKPGPTTSRIFDFARITAGVGAAMQRGGLRARYFDVDRPNATSFHGYLGQVGWRTVILRGATPGGQTVDEAIKRTISAILEQNSGDIVLGSHDGAPSGGGMGFPELLDAAIGLGRRVAILGLTEHFATALVAMAGVQVIDLQRDTGGVLIDLDRPYVTDLEHFDPRLIL